MLKSTNKIYKWSICMQTFSIDNIFLIKKQVLAKSLTKQKEKTNPYRLDSNI